MIFPSVENKPTIVNSSFTYDAGKNLNGVTVESAMLYMSPQLQAGLIDRLQCRTNNATKQVFENDGNHCSVKCPIWHCIPFQGYSCADLFDKGLAESGIYYLQIDGTKYWFLKTYCEMEAAEGGWTVRSRVEVTDS